MPLMVFIKSGTGKGQCRRVTELGEYPDELFTVSDPWLIPPLSDSVFIFFTFPPLALVTIERVHDV